MVRIDPAKNQHRYYHRAVWPGLFGDVSLVREFGRIGQPGQQRLDAHPDTAAAVAKMNELLRRKEREGLLAGRMTADDIRVPPGRR